MAGNLKSSSLPIPFYNKSLSSQHTNVIIIGAIVHFPYPPLLDIGYVGCLYYDRWFDEYSGHVT
jgi:hypothetical protein